jgi:hypothetical protein
MCTLIGNGIIEFGLEASRLVHCVVVGGKRCMINGKNLVVSILKMLLWIMYIAYSQLKVLV